jgi:hypothetical protein
MKSRPLSILSIGSYLLAVAGGICGMVTEINEEQVSQHIGQGVQFLESVGSAGGEADEGIWLA